MISKQNGNPNPTPYQTLESAQPSIASIYHTKTYKNCQCSSSLPPGGFQKCGLHWSAITYFQHSQFGYILFCLCHKNDTTKKRIETVNKTCKAILPSNLSHLVQPEKHRMIWASISLQHLKTILDLGGHLLKLCILTRRS